ncbi:MAG TPA: sugar phosphate isomerase/epimerase, partial [Geminicoccaceae bacterium]|nr:sugar phosphate isomerase/epimerase [Geminicoccaceae bacterium]
AEICRRRDLRYTVHGALSCNLMDEAHLELHKGVVRAMLELCDAVGAVTLVHHPGTVPARPQPAIDRLHEIERGALRELGDVAARYGVRLAVETLYVESADGYTADPFRLAREIAAVDHPRVCGTLDFSHVAIMSTCRGLDFAAAVRAFAPFANHLHVHDSFGRPRTVAGYTESEDLAFGMGDLHLPIGWGGIDWDGILPGLPLRPDTVLIVELRPRYWSELGACADAARRLADLLNGGRAPAA